MAAPESISVLGPVDKDDTPESKWFRDRNPNIVSDRTGWGDGEASPLALTRPMRPKADVFPLIGRLLVRLVGIAVVMAVAGYGSAWAYDEWTAQDGWVDGISASSTLKFRFPDEAEVGTVAGVDVAQTRGDGWEVVLQEVGGKDNVNGFTALFGDRVNADKLQPAAQIRLGSRAKAIETFRHQLGDAVRYWGLVDRPEGRKRVDELLIVAGGGKVIVLTVTVDADRQDLGQFLLREIEETLVEP